MNRRTIYRKLGLLACFATLASRLFGETVGPLTSELEHVLAEISIVPPPLDAPNEMRIWERRMRALAKGSEMGTNLWPALPALVTLAGHTNLQVSISAAVLIANAKPEQHPQWNQVQAQLRSTTNAYRGFECLLPGPDQYTRFYNPPNRRFAIAVLGIIGPPAKSTTPSLVRLLKSDAEIDVPLWCQAAGSLHGMGIDGDVYLPILRKRFADSAEDLVVRSAAAHALACAKASDAETIALLRGGLNDSYAQVRLGAARALLLLGRPLAEVQPTLAALLKHKLVSMRSGALRVLAEIGPAASPLRSEIQSHLNDSAPAVRTAAQEALQALSLTLKAQQQRANPK